MNQLLSQLGTFAIVTVVTLLVWLYAEDANIEEYTDQSVQVQFVMPSGVKGVGSPSGPVTLQLDFNGSNGQFQEFLELTRNGAIQVDLPLSLGPGDEFKTGQVNTRTLLEDRALRGLGINITSVQPTNIDVSFERYIDVPIMLSTINTDGLGLAEPPQVLENIRQVTVNMLAGRKSELDGVTATVSLTKEDLAGLPKGEPRQITVPVVLPESLAGLTPQPATVDLLVTLADDLARTTIERRSISLSYPSSINENYIVTIDETDRIITKFELEGPKRVIDQLKAEPTSPLVWATVRLTNEEAGAAADGEGMLTKAVDIIAPPGVVLVSDVQRVTIRVKRRPAATNE